MILTLGKIETPSISMGLSASKVAMPTLSKDSIFVPPDWAIAFKTSSGQS